MDINIYIYTHTHTHTQTHTHVQWGVLQRINATTNCWYK